MLQQRVFKPFFQQFYSGKQRTTKILVSGFPALLDGRRSKSRLRRTHIILANSRGHELELKTQRHNIALPDVRERTLVAVKPDGVQRRLVGQIIQRFEQRGFKLVGMKMLQASEDLLSQHYTELRTKAFYPSLLHYMTSGPVVVMVWEGHNVVQTSRTMVGPTNPIEAHPGTVRGDFSTHVSRNVVHASDSPEGAKREIQLWFQGQELVKWDCCDQHCIREA